MKKNDGGPAFARPIGSVFGPGGEWSPGAEGMSLRAWLAGPADFATHAVFAAEAVRFADALIAELEKEQ